MQIGSRKWKNVIYDGAKDLEVQIDQEKIDQFGIHALELLKWSRKTNLTAISDPLEIAVKHFLDSIAPAPIIPPDISLLDMGSGGGFPGIPLKIMIPSLSVTLIDASRKKVGFLKHVIRMLGLDNIEACHIRAEDLSGDFISNNTYDVIISRALSSMVNFVQMSLPLLSNDGFIIAMKGKMSFKKIESALSLIKKRSDIQKNSINNFNIILKKYRLPYLKSERSIVILKSFL
ncbi:MAG: 16S rRNA (guanine(527)-N(7))-methyltransferase RsmG [Thermodesulfobacteriota bacterium]|nr:16S rRNA (guanine(527)-N(7))-methyltransferase RsmG [Thermodesulfobacteriota bacterium]